MKRDKFEVKKDETEDFIGDEVNCYSVVHYYREDDKEWYHDKVAILTTKKLAKMVAKMLNKQKAPERGEGWPV